MEEYRKRFCEIYDENIKRDGALLLREYLEKSDFFTAPASSRFHCAFEGGLVLHSVNTYERLVKNLISDYGESWEQRCSRETAAICGLLHDLCKIDYYKIDMRNVKEDGNWVQKPFYTRDEKLPYGHGEKSVYIISGFMRLTREEALSINWHMGGFDTRAGDSNALGEAFAKFPLAVLLHVSDLEATYIDEKRREH